MPSQSVIGSDRSGDHGGGRRMPLLNSYWRRHKRTLFVLSLFLLPFVPIFFLRFDLPRLHIYDRAQAWVVHPIAEALDNSVGGVRVLWGRYVALIDASRENERMKSETADLRRRILELEEQGRENDRLRKLLDMPELEVQKGIGANIIGQDASFESLSFVINVGANQGIERRMPVVHADGVVGTIVKVFANSSVFLSFLDPTHDVDGTVVRSRGRMIVEGKGKHLLARLKYLDRSEDVRVGDTVITGGLDGVFPKGIPIGFIVRVDRPEAGVMQEAELRAAVDPGTLEEVIVLRKPKMATPGEEVLDKHEGEVLPGPAPAPPRLSRKGRG